MKLPKTCIISTEEAARLRRDSKYHTVVKEGDVAIHFVHNPVTGVNTIVDYAALVNGKIRR